MTATLKQERFTGPEWIFERKFDGIRLLAFRKGAKVELLSRNQLPRHYPAIAGVHLIDYKVRVINSKDETSAAVRVVIECRRENPDGSREIFGTIGVSTNVIDASWQALADAYEYHLIHVEEAATTGEQAL